MPLAGDKAFKLKSLGGGFYIKTLPFGYEAQSDSLRKRNPRSRYAKMPAVSESLDDGIKKDFGFSILTLPTPPPPHCNKHQLLFFSGFLF